MIFEKTVLTLYNGGSYDWFSWGRSLDLFQGNKCVYFDLWG